jgi:hypothetical protein
MQFDTLEGGKIFCLSSSQKLNLMDTMGAFRQKARNDFK